MVFLHLYQTLRATIPCTPTRTDVAVHLRSAISNRNINESNFGVMYSPFDGFTIERPVWNMEWSDLICEAYHGSHSVEVPIKISWSPAPIYPLKPVITTSSLAYIVDREIKLNCSLEVEKGIIVGIDWKTPQTNQSPLKLSTTRISIGRSTDLVSSVLKIKKSQLSDSGFYQCKASYSNSQSNSTEIEILVQNRRQILIQENIILGKVGSEIHYNIPLNHSLIPQTYSWKKDGMVVNDYRFKFEFTSNYIQIDISSLQHKDNGTYELILNVMDGFDATYKFHLNVIEIPVDYILNPWIFLAIAMVAFIFIVIISWKYKGSKNGFDPSINYSKSYQKSLEKIVPSKLIIERRQIILDDSELGCGNFGSVSRGILRIPGGEEVTVAVKRVRDGTDQTTLIEEIQLMSVLNPHSNVVNMIGTVVYPEIMIVVEYCPMGNLKDFLIRHQKIFNVKPQQNISNVPSQIAKCLDQINPNYEAIEVQVPLKLDTLVEYAIQVAEGMKFLASKKIIHRDLAARNVLLVNQTVIKICDFGLSKNCNNLPEAIYRKEKSSPLPYKWMAIESIIEKVYTTKSDVWSYGILLWELFTLGQDPYPNHGINLEFVDFLKQGHRLDIPDLAPQIVGEIMASCWREDPDERPSFVQIQETLVNCK